MKLLEHPDFDQVILQAAEHFQLRPAIIEKDYYVTEVLRIYNQVIRLIQGTRLNSGFVSFLAGKAL